MTKVLKEGAPPEDLELPNPTEYPPMPSAAQASRSRKPRNRERRAPVNPAALKIETNVEIPAREHRGRVSPWVPVLQQMEVGDSLSIPDTTANKMGYVRLIAKRIGMTIIVRANGTGARLWRVESDAVSEDGL